ncbi:MAG: M23 family metallopeptidase, partial [Chloroflexi bacterium]|nr:M23 family metallopeptidase [Chloroflexota bacterium]
PLVPTATAVPATPITVETQNLASLPTITIQPIVQMATAVSTPTPELPTFTTIVDTQMQETAVSLDAAFVQITSHNTSLWQYDADNFVHPIALDAYQNNLYMIDAGRVLVFDRTMATLPSVLLAPGDDVDDVRVIEPFDLSVIAAGLLVLDSAGDVYFYEWASETWSVDRYDRPVGESSGHYYVAVAGEGNGRFLLETSYKYVRLYGEGVLNRLWPILEESRGVDVAVSGEAVFVLTQAMQGTMGQLAKYRDTAYVTTFRPMVEFVQPRQVVATDTAVYVLDMAGKRLLDLHPDSGELRVVYQMPAGVTAVWSDGDVLVFAGRNQLFLWNGVTETVYVAGNNNPLDFDPTLFESVHNFTFPIIGTQLTQRELQMPGAPRHYRLGVHEGVDFYWRRGTAVYAAAGGVVIRATLDYTSPTAEQFEMQRLETQTLGFTPPDALDFYRGMQVWIQHEDGIVSRYVHLSSIDSQIVEGATVTQGQLIGEIGNSGSPSSVDSETKDAHLHFELWINDFFFGQFLRPIEIRESVERLFSGYNN